METIKLDPNKQNPEAQFSNPPFFEWENNPSNKKSTEILPSAMEEDETEESLADMMVCYSDARLVTSGFVKGNCADDVVLFINTGADASAGQDTCISLVADKYFEGGDIFQTEEIIAEGGDCPSIYQSARLGNFSYRIDDLPPGDYVVDLHFAEIINICGPKGMRVFNVFMQDEKVLSDFDIYSIVGSNRSLQLVDARVSIKDDGVLILKFERITGSPIVSGICIRRVNFMSVDQLQHDNLVCKKCASEMEFPSAQRKVSQMKSTAKYEKKIQELKQLLQLKTDECYQSWMSWTTANEQLEKVKMDLDNKTFRTYSLDQTIDKQSQKLSELSGRYDKDKKFWILAIDDLTRKVKLMKEDHTKLSREAHECADTIPDLSQMVFAVQSLVAQCEDLKLKYNEEQMKRRKLFNELQQTKGNIRVFCRCRPLSRREVLAGCTMVVEFDGANDGELVVLTGGSLKKTFKFDRVYSPKDDQVDVFADASPMATSVLDGYNVCIFAYGQTGTGKTFTMEGTEENRGVNYRTLEELFRIANERTETFSYRISVSVVEVYNEQIRDLLATSFSTKKLEIKQAPEGSHHIPGIVEATVENIKEVWNVLQAGSSTRSVGSNNVNEHSSRSHCMLCISVKAKNLINGECTKSKLWLVDLAGSERLAKTDVQGERLKEAQNINKSLSALGDVISALANKSSHIPYRNSKLTHLLQDSLGGDSKTLMFLQISPSDQDVSETTSSLNFATRVRGVELGPVKKQVDTSELQKMKIMLEKAKEEARVKDKSLRKLEETLQTFESKVKGKDLTFKNQQDKIKELESQLELKTTTHSQTMKQVSHLSEKLKGKEHTESGLKRKVMELEHRLSEQGELQSDAYQKKVKDLENELKQEVLEYESRSSVLQHKVDELERKMKVQGQSSESFLHQKIKELEEKIRVQEQQLAINTPVTEPTHPLKSSAMDSKQCGGDELISVDENRILRSSQSVNHRESKRPLVVKTNNDPHHVVSRKRSSRTSEEENMHIAKKIRPSNPSKPSRTTTAKTTSTAVQRPSIHSKTSRDQVQGVKERDPKKRMWAR
ncbi:microtubule binding motor protein [Lithospermum erythrorhizon]|uniref:Microtubule binding motor protein n=1 Tax=Lithospermum erythrorhizon TaxID=34254 RepID=A0AAV3RSN4_LITER